MFSRYLFSRSNAATFQEIDVSFAVVHEATDQAVITEDNGCHFSDVLMALVLSDVASVIHQTWHQEPFTNWFICTLLYLLKKKKGKITVAAAYEFNLIRKSSKKLESVASKSASRETL